MGDACSRTEASGALSARTRSSTARHASSAGMGWGEGRGLAATAVARAAAVAAELAVVFMVVVAFLVAVALRVAVAVVFTVVLAVGAVGALAIDPLDAPALRAGDRLGVPPPAPGADRVGPCGAGPPDARRRSRSTRRPIKSSMGTSGGREAKRTRSISSAARGCAERTVSSKAWENP